MNPTTLITRSPELLSAVLDDELVLMSIDLGNYYGISSTARRIWELLETPVTLAFLLKQLAVEFDASPDILRTDVEEFLGRLQREGLVGLS